MARQRLNSGDTAGEDLPKPKLNLDVLKKGYEIFKYIHPYRLKFAWGMVFLILSSLTMLTIPALLGEMVDAAQGVQKYDWLPGGVSQIAIIAMSILFFLSCISFFRIRLFVEVAEKALATIRREVYDKLICLPMDFFANRRVGELNSRISSDLSQIQDTLTTTLAELIRQTISLVLSVALLIFVSPKLALMNMAILPIIVLVGFIFGRFIRKISKQTQDKLADSNAIVQETLTGISNVKAFVNEFHETTRYADKLRDVVCLAVRGATFRGVFASFIIFCVFGAVIVVIWYGATLVARGEISVGDLTTYILYSMFVAGSMGSFPELYANLQRAIGSSERVLEILSEKQEKIEISANNKIISKPLRGDVMFDHVMFSYPTRPDIQTLNDISFHIRAGQKMAIVGPSGTGKSTIASLILQFYTPTGGQIYFDGASAETYDLTDIRNQVAIVPQDVLLFGGSIAENIGYGKLSASLEEIISAAKRANAHDFIMSFPEGYHTMVGERGVKLSGGQRQRVAIARALLKNPSVLILDEATSSLDSESERLVQLALEELMRDRTSIIIAHRLSTIRDADKILVIENGQVRDSGNHQELMAKGTGLYHHLYSLQSLDLVTG